MVAPRKFIFKRDNKTHRFQLTVNDVLYDLTDVQEIKFTVRESDSESAEQTFQCTKTGGDVTLEAQAGADIGKMNAIVEPVDTSSADAGGKVYDIEVKDVAGKIKTFGVGVYDILQDITQ